MESFGSVISLGWTGECFMDTPTSRQAKWLRVRAVLSAILAWVFVWALIPAIGWGHWWLLAFACAFSSHVLLLMSVSQQRGWLYNWGRLERFMCFIWPVGATVSLLLSRIVFPHLVSFRELLGAVVPIGVAIYYATFMASRILESVPVLRSARE